MIKESHTTLFDNHTWVLSSAISDSFAKLFSAQNSTTWVVILENNPINPEGLDAFDKTQVLL